MNPQAVLPALVGNLVFDDNFTRIIIPRCKVDKINVRIEDGGEVWDLIVLDRRWRWRELGAISGVYNQVDPNGKTLPWTERTPFKLAELCLQALGEKGYRILLPPVNVLPPVAWNYVPPAQALSAFVESLGCRVIYRLDTDTVLICPPGDGNNLPMGSIPRDGPSLDNPERPDRIVIVGQPVRFQARFKLEAVGEEWNGEIKPLRELSYAPEAPAVAVAHQVQITPSAVAIGNVFTLTLEDEDFSKSYEFAATAATVANVTAGLTALINAAVNFPWRAVDNTTTLTITGPPGGLPFTVSASAAVGGGGGAPKLTWQVTVQGREAGQDPWAYSAPPTFGSVKETERLSKNQARALAQKCAFKYYRITAEASGTEEKGPLRIPDYDGPIVRIQQIVLHQTRAQPVEPTEPNDAILDDQRRRRKILFYDGHTRDKPATCWGSYHHGYSGGNVNTRPDTEVAVDFSIDAERHLVLFSQCMVYLVSGKVKPAPIVLETGCNVRDATTNAMLTIEGFADLGPPVFGTPPLFVLRDDIQATVLGIYDETNVLKASLTDYPDARARVGYYLQAYAQQFRNVVAQDRTYNGLEPIWLDGAIAQVTWTVGEQGAETQASRNNEHSRYIPPYFARKKNEAMDAIGKARKGSQPPFAGPINRLYEPPSSQSGSR